MGDTAPATMPMTNVQRLRRNYRIPRARPGLFMMSGLLALAGAFGLRSILQRTL